MSLRRKTLWVVAIAFTVAIGLFFIAAQLILERSYRDLEVQVARRNTQRALNALYDSFNDLNTLAVDWGHWDATYQFVQDGNVPYVRENLQVITYTNTDVNYNAFLNRDAEAVFARMVDLELWGYTTIPDELSTHFQRGSPLLTFDSNEDRASSFISLPDGLLYVVAMPITDTLGTAPSAGAIVWGRYLTDTVVAAVAEATQLDIDLIPYGSAEAQDDVPSAGSALTEPGTIVTQPLDEQRIGGYTLLADIDGNPLMLLEVQMPRDIYAQGKTSLNYFLAALLAISGLFTAILVILVERSAIMPLKKLSDAVANVRLSRDMTVEVPRLGNDELGSLSEGIRGMLDALADSRTRLQEAHDRLEHRVAERTVELAEANCHLTEEIAERKLAQEELAQARDQALESLRLKTQILANVSHDARTPLNIITLNAEMMQRGRGGTLSEKHVRMVESIFVNARQLLAFHNNLLGEAQLGQSKIKLLVAPISPESLFAEVAALTKPLAERKGLTLDWIVDPVLPVDHVQGDADRLKQVLVNLVDNAIKFTDKGGITLIAKPDDTRYWALQVRDSGAGIPAEAQPHIFDAFYQVDGTITRTASRGVGLGLSIVRQLISLMGGTVGVESTPGEGTTFTIRLAYRQEDEHTDEREIALRADH